MAVLINFKICDNSKDCSGVVVCPVGAFCWDEKGKTIAVDNKKCVSCGRCEKACPVGAIMVAKSDEEYKKLKKEIEEDPRRVSDLFIDRYGAEPLDPAFIIPKSKFAVQILEATQTAVVELFNPESIRCRLHSIPIKDLFSGSKVKYRKIEVDKKDPLLKRFKIGKLPSFLFFRNGGLIGKVEGYYDRKKKRLLMNKINQIIGEN